MSFASSIFLDKLFDCLKDDSELLVVFFLQALDFSGEVAIGVHEAAQLDESAHDGDIDLDGTRGTKDAGEHGDALFGEGVGKI